MTIDPNQFIITRKRKKYKFALFANSSICFELHEWRKRPIDVVELGAGTGLFSVELAARSPEQAFVAVDVKADRLQKGAHEAEARGLKNIWFVRARADQLHEIVSKNSLTALWLTFPDPFPKERSAKRRMTHPIYLKLYRDLLRKGLSPNREDKMHEDEGGALYLKHDNREFFQWSLEQLVAEKWRIDELSFDLHESDLSDEYKILTTYEQRWLGEGLKTNFVKAMKP